MKKVAMLVVLAGLCGIAEAKPPLFVERPGELEFSGQLIVRPRQDLSAERSTLARERLSSMVKNYYPEVDEYTIFVPGADRSARGAGENDLAAELMSTGDYQYAHPNWICYPINTPNDPLFPSMWHHVNMQSELGWNISTGSSSILVAMTDTGVDYTHVELQNRVPGYNSASNMAEVDGGQIWDIHGHGTHVAGCAAATGNNNTGVAGVGWNLKFMMCRVTDFSSGGAYFEDLTEAARWAVEHGSRTASTSYTGVEYETISTTGDYIDSIGGLYLYAADNSSRDHYYFDWPNVIVVGATDWTDNRAWFSSYGLACDVFAPGDGIWSSTVGNNYAAWSGTSMATPVANGVLGVIWSVNPALTHHEARDIMFNSCTDIGAAGEDNVYGHGRVNLYQAVLAAQATLCLADYNGDGFVNGNDYDAFADDFDVADPAADLNNDGFVNGNDYDLFAEHFDVGC
ncbi:MAG: S8 family serine peptidase [Phycisphaerae bacterium]|nr:S8 family serine peptidase [Phycisphaerae bacterium]